jgi:hypothetical protein
MPIKNNDELLKMFSPILINIVIKVSNDLLQILDDYIIEYTYGQLPNANYYNKTTYPTFQFLNAFKFDGVKMQKLNEYVSELFYDWQTLDFDASTLLHGSSWGGDARENLADILNINGIPGIIGNKIRSSYWDIFITDMFDKGGIEKLFDKYTKSEFGRLGILVTKG